MKNEKYDIIAVDIAKDALQIQAATQASHIPNASAGFDELSKLVHSCDSPIVVLEASGGYERDLLLYLNQRDIPVALLNPSRVRAFAQSEGVKAKTDPIDAKIIYRFAEEKSPLPTPKPDPQRKMMADLLDRRSHLSEQLAREKNRLQKSPKAIAKSIERMVRFVQKEIDAIDKRIGKITQRRADLSALIAEMTSVCGVGEMTAWTLIAYLGEITTLSRNKIVALAGLAPLQQGYWEILRQTPYPRGPSKGPQMPLHGGCNGRHSQPSDKAIRRSIEAKRKAAQMRYRRSDEKTPNTHSKPTKKYETNT